jgi:hypothetical protein
VGADLMSRTGAESSPVDCKLEELESIHYFAINTRNVLKARKSSKELKGAPVEYEELCAEVWIREQAQDKALLRGSANKNSFTFFVVIDEI